MLAALIAPLLIPLQIAAVPAGPGSDRLLDTISATRIEPDDRFEWLPRWTAPGRPTLALALSGGAARGVAHLGVLEAMAEDGVEFDAIAGTSMGAVVGAFMSAGYQPEEMQAILTGRDWDAIIAGFDVRNRTLSRAEDVYRQSAQVRIRRHGGRPIQIGAVVDTRYLERELYRYLLAAQVLSEGDFDRLKYRFRAVATDVRTGRDVVPAAGDLVTAVRGSWAIPGVFRPVPYGDALLVDGGVVQNIPVETARAFGGDLVLAVNVTTGLPEAGDLRGAVDVVSRIVDILFAQQNERLLAGADIVLEPDVLEIAGSSFRGQVAPLAAAGRRAWEASRDAAWRKLEAAAADRAPIDFTAIEVSGTSWITAEEIARRLGGAPGTVTRYRIAAEVARALNRGPLQSGRAEWIDRPPGRVVRFVFEEGAVVRRVVREGAPIPRSLEALTPRAEGLPFSLAVARELLWRHRQALIEEGRVMVFLDDFAWDPETGTLRGRLEEATVGRIRPRSAGDAPIELARRVFADLEGQRFVYDRLADRLDEMIERNAIVDWALRPKRGEDAQVDLTALVHAEKYLEATAGAGYRGELGWAGFARIAGSNFTGRGDTADLILGGGSDVTTLAGRYRSEYGLGFQNLGGEIGGALFSNRFPLVSENQSIPEDAEERWEGGRLWGNLIRRLRWGAVVQAGMTWERVVLHETDAEPEVIVRRRAATLLLEIDRHDRLLFPTRGAAASISAERSVAGPQIWKASLRTDGAFSPGAGRLTLTVRAAAGVSEGADRRPYWFNPGGYRDLYGFIPYGAAAPQFARAGATARVKLLDVALGRLYAEAGADIISASIDRAELGRARNVRGWGGAIVAHTRFLGPIAAGAMRNEDGATSYFVTFGPPFLDP